MDTPIATLDSIFEQAERLSPVDKLKLIARLADMMVEALSPDEKRGASKSAVLQDREIDHAKILDRKLNSPYRRNVRGILADLGSAPSEADIAEARQDMTQDFPREDIA